MLISKQQALDYHNGERPGKIEVTPTKPCRTQRDLSLAYTPGVYARLRSRCVRHGLVGITSIFPGRDPL